MGGGGESSMRERRVVAKPAEPATDDQAEPDAWQDLLLTCSFCGRVVRRSQTPAHQHDEGGAWGLGAPLLGFGAEEDEHERT